MSVAGIDFGSKSNVVALARRKGIDVVMNEESKRETPSLINFGDKCVQYSSFLY
jgi:heat shock protein 4